jgi:adenylosuccinate lyase
MRSGPADLGAGRDYSHLGPEIETEVLAAGLHADPVSTQIVQRDRTRRS